MNLKSLLTLAAAFVFCAVAFSQNTDGDKNTGSSNPPLTAASFAEAHLQKLEQDVQLTNDQKAALLEAYKKLYNNRQAAETRASSREQINVKQQSQQIFEASCDSILTKEQRLQLTQKQEERKNQSINDHLKNNQQ